MKTFKVTIRFLVVILFTTTVFSQEKWSVEFRPGINFPTKAIDGSDLTAGFGFELKASYYVMPHLSAYAGWGWNQFNIKETSPNDPKIDVQESGYTFGAELKLPVSKPPISYFLSAGAVYNHIKLENNTDNTVVDTDHGFGWQLGGGIAYEFVDNWSLRPEIRYRSLERNLENTGREISLGYIGFGIGLSVRF